MWYVVGLLWFQGIVWALMAAWGLAAWIDNLAATLAANSLGSGAGPVGVQLILIIAAVGCAVGEIMLARRLRGGRKLVVAGAIGTEAFMLCLGVVVAALLLMAGGGLVALIAFGGPALSLVGLMVLTEGSVWRNLTDAGTAGSASSG